MIDSVTGRRRWWAAVAGVAVVGGAVAMLGGLVAAPGGWLDGYVSEAGVAGLPFAGVYRAGLLVLAAGVGCLAAGLRLPVVTPVLVVAALLAGVSGAVPCSVGCPLPPFEVSTFGDVVHAGAAILGMVALAGAMLASWWVSGDRVLRWLSGVGAAVTVPLGGVMGLTMLFVGRGALGAGLERVLLVVAVSWLVGAAVLTFLRNSVKMELWKSGASRSGSPRLKRQSRG